MKKVLEIANRMDEMDKVAAFTEEIGEEVGLSVSVIMSINLALEEAVANVVMYAYPHEEGQHKVTLSAEMNKNGELLFVLSDKGVPFDPTQVPQADVTLSVEDRPIGGLGIFLVRKIMGDVSYERIGDENLLKMRKKIK